jgi:hypothetical protein
MTFDANRRAFAKILEAKIGVFAPDIDGVPLRLAGDGAGLRVPMSTLSREA